MPQITIHRRYVYIPFPKLGWFIIVLLFYPHYQLNIGVWCPRWAFFIPLMEAMHEISWLGLKKDVGSAAVQNRRIWSGLPARVFVWVPSQQATFKRNIYIYIYIIIYVIHIYIHIYIYNSYIYNSRLFIYI